MAFVVLFLVAAVLGTYGYSRGALRLGLALAPLLFGSVLVWLLGPMFYRFDALRNLGLVWPGLILCLTGAGGGYIVQFSCRKKLPKKLRRADRVGGVVVGLFVCLIVVWLGCVYSVVLSASNQPGGNSGSAGRLADALNTAVVRWIPGPGAGSDAMMNMMEIATADEHVRRKVIEDFRLNRLLDLPQMQAVLNDAKTQSDVQAAAKGSIMAVWRLQKDPHILELLASDEIAEALSARSLEDIAGALREAGQTSAAGHELDH